MAAVLPGLRPHTSPFLAPGRPHAQHRSPPAPGAGSAEGAANKHTQRLAPASALPADARVISVGKISLGLYKSSPPSLSYFKK